MKSELELLKEKVEQLEEKQNYCKHEWLELQRDEIEEEIYETLWAGELAIPSPTGRYKKISCLSRTCSKCGKKEYTKEPKELKEFELKKEKELVLERSLNFF